MSRLSAAEFCSACALNFIKFIKLKFSVQISEHQAKFSLTGSRGLPMRLDAGHKLTPRLVPLWMAMLPFTEPLLADTRLVHSMLLSFNASPCVIGSAD